MLNSISNIFKINRNVHPFHLVKPSPWPFCVSLILANLLFLLVIKIHGIMVTTTTCIFLGSMYQINRYFFLLGVIGWFWDIIVEATFEGRHTVMVRNGLRAGFIIFILSEVIFFASFFWAFFYISAAPSIAIGYEWPARKFITLNPWELPLLNTFLLLSSGVTVTYAHYVIATNRKKQFIINPSIIIQALLLGYCYWDKFFIPKYIEKQKILNDDLVWKQFYIILEREKTPYNSRHVSLLALWTTIVLGCCFTYIQYYEYTNANFSISTSAYGSLFYILTGFHGLHVLVGTLSLFICLIRHAIYHFTRDHHVGLECAIWYWHFVDVVWIFLYFFVYIWGGRW